MRIDTKVDVRVVSDASKSVRNGTYLRESNFNSGTSDTTIAVRARHSRLSGKLFFKTNFNSYHTFRTVES